jgi:hypothetical protein
MMADGNFTASLWRGSTGQWTESQLLSFSNQNGTSFSYRPEVNIPAIAVKSNHRLYRITADEAGIVEYKCLRVIRIRLLGLVGLIQHRSCMGNPHEIHCLVLFLWIVSAGSIWHPCTSNDHLQISNRFRYNKLTGSLHVISLSMQMLSEFPYQENRSLNWDSKSRGRSLNPVRDAKLALLLEG